MGIRHMKAVKQLLKNVPTNGPPELVKRTQLTVLRQAADMARLNLEFGRLDSDNCNGPQKLDSVLRLWIT